VGGLVGSFLGIALFRLLSAIGQLDLVISLSFVAFLLAVGALMGIESVRTILRRRRGAAPRRKAHQHTFVHGLPFKLRFRKSKLYVSAFAPITIGFMTGLFASVMGIGAGFIMIPAMIYLLGMATSVVVGTSLLQIALVASVATVLHAATAQTVDILLVVMLSAGAVFGAELGVRGNIRLPEDRLVAIPIQPEVGTRDLVAVGPGPGNGAPAMGLAARIGSGQRTRASSAPASSPKNAIG